MRKICAIFVIAFVACASVLLASDKGEKMQIQLSFDNEKIIVELEDNAATRDFYTLLPLRLTFSDYVGKEKISPELPKRLNTKGLNGYEPEIGDLFYFSPWGNLGIFYDKQPFHSGLVKFGKLKAQDLAKIRAKRNDFVVEFSKSNGL